jgi:ADP-ribose pyrophosphatase
MAAQAAVAAAERTVRALHVNARSAIPAYPARFHVPDELVAWAASFPQYAPPDYTQPSIVENKFGGADPHDARQVDFSKRSTYEQGGRISVEPATGRPLNPRGRTGLRGRGKLWRWGPNHAADPIVTRLNAATGLVEMVAIQRRDNGQWAIPGGMVDPGETPAAAARREFEEEAVVAAPDEQPALKKLLDELFAAGNATVVYSGYVDDPRNTDNAWIETTAVHCHCSPAQAAALALRAGDDAKNVRWLPVDASEKDYLNLYAGHRAFVDAAVARLRTSAALRARG